MRLGLVLKDASPACPTMRGQHALLLNGDTRHTLEKIRKHAGHHFTNELDRRNQAQERADGFRRRSKLVTATLHAELTHHAFVLLRTNDHDFFVFAPSG
jgi:hypothetical protein